MIRSSLAAAKLLLFFFKFAQNLHQQNINKFTNFNTNNQQRQNLLTAKAK
jgi:hypothetical protein